MTTHTLSEDLVEILRVLQREGGTDCTGTCHHRKPGEFHCHTFGRMLNISSQGVKNRLLALMRMGLVQRVRVAREVGAPLVRFILTSQAEDLLANKYKCM